MNVEGSNYKPGNIYVPKYRIWVFEMEKGTTIMFRPELMKAMMVGTAKTFEKEFTAGIIHLNTHVKERTMHNEFNHVVDRIYPIKRANNTMKIFRKNYPVWSKHLQHGLFPDTIYQQPESEFELTVVDSLMAQQRERERIFNKDAQSAKVTIPEDIKHYLSQQPVGKRTNEDFDSFEKELQEKDLTSEEWADDVITAVHKCDKRVAPETLQDTAKKFKRDPSPFPTEYE